MVFDNNNQRKNGLIKKIFFAGLTTTLFLVALEVLLAVFGVKMTNFDPLKEFASSNPLFIQHPEEPSTRITSPEKRKLFNEQHFEHPKPTGLKRVFCLGGSTTYGRPYDDRTSFSAWLREFLAEMSPNSWEVINAGGISYGSFRIAALVEEIVEYDPDLLVVYTGHNEFLERQTYSNLLNTSQEVRNAASWLARLRTYAAIRSLLSPASPVDSEPSREVEAILDKSIGPEAYHRDPEWNQDVIEQFRLAMLRLIGTAQSKGIPIVLVKPAANLQDFSPFKSEVRSTLSVADSSRIETDTKLAEAAIQTQDWQTASSIVEQALLVAPEYADLHYLQGKILLNQGDLEPALQAFQRARDNDVCALRAPQDILDALTDIATQTETRLIDFESRVAELSTTGIPGSTEFLDHVHPAILVHREIAVQILQALQSMDLIAEHENWQQELVPVVTERIQSSVDEKQHAKAQKNLAKVLGWAGQKEESDRLILESEQLLASDPEALSLAGNAHFRNQDWVAAEKAFLQALDLDPQNSTALEGLGLLRSSQGNPRESQELFQKALKSNPGNVTALYNLGNTYFDSGDLERAAQFYRQALAIAPEYVPAHKNLGLVFSASGEPNRAVECFEKALQLTPFDQQLRLDFGFVLTDAGEYQQAQKIFAESATQPDHAKRAQIGLLICHLGLGQISEAQRIASQLRNSFPDDDVLHKQIDLLLNQ